MNKLLIVLFLSTITLITGCAKKKEDTLSSVAPLSSIEGTWLSGCYNDGTYANIKTSQFTSGGSFTANVDAYINSDCTNPAFQAVAYGDYEVANVTDQTVAQIGEIDFTYAAIEITPASAAGATYMNTASHCGLNNWANGVAQDVTGLTCNLEAMPTNGQTVYSIFSYILNSSLIDYGITPGDLMFGAESASKDGTTGSDRFDETDGSYLFRKQ